MKSAYFLFFLLLFSFVLPGNVLSIGIASGNFPSTIVAEPGKSYSFGFILLGESSQSTLYINGDLKEYATVKEDSTKTKDKPVTLTITFPEFINQTPGRHTLYVGAAQKPAGGGGITVTANVQIPITFFILYPEKYIEASLQTQNVNENETADFNLLIRNYGTPDISSLKAYIEIYNGSEPVKKVDYYSPFFLKSGDERNLNFKVNTQGMVPGVYTASAVIDYDGLLYTVNGSFRIGTMKLKVTNYTRMVYTNKINKFDVEIENEWNGGVSGVYAEIAAETPSKNVTGKSVPANIKPFSKSKMEAYLDMKDIMPGLYPLTINVYYENDKTVERGILTAIKPKLLEGVDRIWLIIGAAVLILIIILTIINIILFAKSRKKQ